MPHVTVSYDMFLPGGHHRQPRNTSIELDLAPTAGGDVPVGGSYTPPFFPQLPYSIGGGNGMAQLLFWSVTDGMTGQVLPPAAFSQTVGNTPLKITAWYFPISGPGRNGDGSAIIDDAFSANLGNFIDDTFVDVTSDPTLTNDANVIGIVPTNVAETLKAKQSVLSTTEPFSRWILNDGLMPVGTTTLGVAKGTIGIAIAIYQRPESGIIGRLGQYAEYDPWWWIKTHGGLVPPGPSDPWVSEFAAAVVLAEAANRVSRSLKAGVLEIALKQISNTAAEIRKQIKNIGKSK
ncbi:MAG: hypothetical protein DMF24_04815 [Verrucomicrobia bacterium]|nr:MAG: hypothetical protein DME90_08420 [Verrucomicrobiota bacterium]PYL62239.1 MAG: hypothetical protein DMF24_04815 [Verrucomicrobiota bacterium]